jgi:hypothetical protein
MTALAQTAFAQEALRQVTRDGEGWPRPIIRGGIVNGRGGRQYAVRMTRGPGKAFGWLARTERRSLRGP